MKDKSKLHKKTITNKLGHKTSVWVKNKDSKITPPKEKKNVSFSDAQVKQLQEGFKGINKIDPSSPTYGKLITLLDSLDKPSLQRIANADIKFVSLLAKNRTLSNTQKINKLKEHRNKLPKNHKDRQAIQSKIDSMTDATNKDLHPSKDTKKKLDAKNAPKGNKYETKVYHDTYGSAIDEIDKDAKSRGYEVDQDDLNFAFGDAFFKPKNGETRRKSVGLTKDGKVQKKEMHVQIYNTGNKFEYNAYVN